MDDLPPGWTVTHETDPPTVILTIPGITLRLTADEAEQFGRDLRAAANAAGNLAP